MESHIAVFRGKEIRKTIYNNEWWFAVADVVAVLTDSIDPAGYIKDMRRRDAELSKGWGQIATPLWVETPGGKQKVAFSTDVGMNGVSAGANGQRCVCRTVVVAGVPTPDPP